MKKLICIISITFMLSNSFSQIKINSSNKVGIAEENPVSVLSVKGSGDIYSTAYINNSYTGNYGRALLTYNNNSSGTWGYALFSLATNHSGASMYNMSIKSKSYSPGTYSNRTYGVYSEAGNGLSGYNYGVYGRLIGGQNGTGIYGATLGRGDLNTNGHWAGYFNGNVKITDDLWLTSDWHSSDINLKKEIRSLTSKQSALEAIRTMNPIRYKYKTPLELENQNQKELDTCSLDLAAEYAKRDVYTREFFGLSAQEVQNIYPELVMENGEGYLGVNYTGLIPVLIDAIKEQQTVIETLENEVDLLKKSDLMSLSTRGENENNTDSPILYQNSPNPFTQNTTISYNIPEYSQKSMICIYDLNGTQLKCYQIDTAGVGEQIIYGSELNAGMYIYSLIVDGNLVDSKQMILTE